MDPENEVLKDKSFSSYSTDIAVTTVTKKENNSKHHNASRLSRSSPSPTSIGSSIDCNDSGGSSFFDKSIIQSLRTPDKIIYKSSNTENDGNPMSTDKLDESEVFSTCNSLALAVVTVQHRSDDGFLSSTPNKFLCVEEEEGEGRSVVKSD